MLAQIREAGAASEMAELRQRVTELETAVSGYDFCCDMQQLRQY